MFRTMTIIIIEYLTDRWEVEPTTALDWLIIVLRRVSVTASSLSIHATRLVWDFDRKYIL